MSTPNDGGPAFPVPMWPRQADGQPMSAHDFGLGGMTLRQWYAGQALNGLLSNLFALTDVQRNQYPKMRLEEVASTLSFVAADAMIKEGSK